MIENESLRRGEIVGGRCAYGAGRRLRPAPPSTSDPDLGRGSDLERSAVSVGRVCIHLPVTRSHRLDHDDPRRAHVERSGQRGSVRSEPSRSDARDRDADRLARCAGDREREQERRDRRPLRHSEGGDTRAGKGMSRAASGPARKDSARREERSRGRLRRSRSDRGGDSDLLVVRHGDEVRSAEVESHTV